MIRSSKKYFLLFFFCHCWFSKEIVCVVLSYFNIPDIWNHNQFYKPPFQSSSSTYMLLAFFFFLRTHELGRWYVLTISSTFVFKWLIICLLLLLVFKRVVCAICPSVYVFCLLLIVFDFNLKMKTSLSVNSGAIKPRLPLF